MSSKKNKKRLILAVQAGMLAASIGLYMPAAQALPQGGISATAAFEQVDKELKITGSSDHNVIAWDSFNVANGEKVLFTNNHDYLNYVAGNEHSFIDGTISGGGNVYIINPHGIIFGDHAVIENVGHLYASTRNLTDADFTAFNTNGLLSDTVPASGDIVNRMNASSMNITLEGDTITFTNSSYDNTNNKVTVGGNGNYTVKANEVDIGYSGTGPADGAVFTNLTKNEGATVNYCLLIDAADNLKTDNITGGNKYMLASDINSNSNLGDLGSIIFNGAGYTITRESDRALFGTLTNSKVRNLSLSSTISKSNSSDYVTVLSSLADNAKNSTITSVYNTGSITLSDSDGAAVYIGGILGTAQNTSLKNVSNKASVTATDNVTCENYLGGIAGKLDNSTVASVYNSGAITGNNSSTVKTTAGGIAGQSSTTAASTSVTIQQSYNTGSVTGSKSGGLVGSSEKTAGDGLKLVSVYNTGAVTGTTAGGLLSSLDNVSITNAYSTSKVNGTQSNLYYTTSTTPVAASEIIDGGAWRVYEGQAPLLSAFLQKLSLPENPAAVTYDGKEHTFVVYNGTSDHVTDAGTKAQFTGKVAGTNAGTYSAKLYSDQQGYDISNVKSTLTIKKADLTLTANQASKTYDGSTSVTGDNTYSVSGLVDGEKIKETLTTAFNDANAGDNKTVDFTSKSINILNANNQSSNDNYNVKFVANSSSKINKADLTLTANQASKTYDGTTSVTGNNTYSVSGLVNGETVSGVTLAYDNAEVGTGKTVDFTDKDSIKVTKTDKTDSTSNYNITTEKNTTSSITESGNGGNTDNPGDAGNGGNTDNPGDTGNGGNTDNPGDAGNGGNASDEPAGPTTKDVLNGYNSIQGSTQFTDSSNGEDDLNGDSTLKDSTSTTGIDISNTKQATKIDEEKLAKMLEDGDNDGMNISSNNSGETETEHIEVSDFSDGDEAGKAAK